MIIKSRSLKVNNNNNNNNIALTEKVCAVMSALKRTLDQIKLIHIRFLFDTVECNAKKSTL